ncbi:MAG: T9SS type A sorting domain-containing protein [Candidatus Kapabacteria bacterium]|nr:T9SS type A sorting domain-containing protein [Candidatus Kapabacteria bacterium]
MKSSYLFVPIIVLLIIIQSLILSAAVLPTLPQIFINTKYNPPTGGQTFIVKTSSEFQSALNSANLGDIIEMQAGNIFTGTFVLPNKTSGTGWIYIRSTAYSNLPSPCTRVSPADAVNMPTIVAATGSGGAINTASNAHHYRFVGIEFKPTANSYLYNVIYIGNGETSAGALPNNIVFDRCYIHGDPSAGSRRGVLMNGAYISVIDSYVSDCKEAGADSQALAAYSTTGPLKIVNNYLEGAGENIIFGGSDPSIPNAVASDIEIRCNTIFKPLAWMTQSWTVKNLLEFKNAQRVLVEGNRLENSWPNGQSGFALLFTPRNQNNTAPWSVVQDITFRFNVFVNVAQGINILGFDAPNISQRTSRLLIQNNVLNVTNLGTGGDGRMFQILGGPTDVIFDHNTGFCTNAYMVADGKPKTDYFEFKNNIVSYAAYGFIGTGTANAMTTLNAYFNPNWLITKNAVIGGSATNYPAGSFFPANNAAVNFIDFTGGNYRLSASSIYKNLATDGKDLGADIDSINLMSIYQCDTKTKVSDLINKQDLMIFPNPSDEILHIRTNEMGDNKAEISVYNLFGENLITITSNSKEGSIDMTKFPDGIYILAIKLKERTEVRKIIVRH